MRVPYQWMRDYIKTDLNAREVAEKMVMTGNGVESICDLSERCKRVVVGRIVALEKHPNADKLQICSVDVGEELVKIVTGADNVFVGALVPVALHGAKLPNGTTIKKGKLRGVESYGMLCSGEELCLSEADYPGAGVYGILILKEDWAPGTDMNEVLMTSDTVIDFEVGANRPDCLSILGIAKEASAALGVTVSVPAPVFDTTTESVEDYLSVEVSDPDLCPRYIAMMAVGVKIQPSPRWMQERLKAAGVRPINNIVDITNFVMLETGQPMHAYDYEDIRDKKIVVRRAKEGERMVTLDGKLRTLSESTLLITDGQGPIGIAGVMGAENSEIKQTTETVVFESAKFTYGNIRQTSRKLGLSTEASMRFSKGIDVVNTDYAIRRACQLVQALGAGQIVGGSIDILSAHIEEKMIEVTPAEVNALLGTDIEEETMIDCLERVFIWTEKVNGKIRCYIPHFRGDMDGKADVAEEIARIYGYDNIPIKEPGGRRMYMDDPKIAARDILKYYIVSLGFYECQTYSFTGASVWDKLALPQDHPYRKAVRILNPLGDDTAYMRTTLLGDMLTVLATNLKRKNKAVRLFEMNPVYLPKELPLRELPDERLHLILGGSGDMDFFAMKGAVENILGVRRVAGEVEFRPGGGTYLHPGRKAEIFIDGVRIGEMGEIHPDVADNFEISQRAYVAELDLKTVFEIAEAGIRFTALPRFPAIERDIAVIVDEQAQAGAIGRFIEKHGGKYLEKAVLFDVYQGKGIPEGKKSLAYAPSFRSKEGTLTDGDIEMEKLLSALKQAFGAELRE